jgi:hypothetical protein
VVPVLFVSPPLAKSRLQVNTYSAYVKSNKVEPEYTSSTISEENHSAPLPVL